MAGNQGAQVGSAHVSIFPVMTGFRSAVNAEAKAAGSSASRSLNAAFKGTGTKSGTQIGRELKAAFKASSSGLADQVLSVFQKDVDKATSNLAKARRKMADDAGRVQVAEARLNEALQKSGEGSASAIAATERLRSARSRLSVSTAAYKNSIDQLKSANEGLARAQAEVEKASAKSVSVFGRVANAVTGPVRTGLSSLGTFAKSGVSKVTSAFSAGFSRLPAFIQAPLGKVSSFFGSAFSKIASTASSGASKIASVMRTTGSGVASGMGVAVGAAAAGAAAIGTALVTAGTAALGSYAQYEQLVGGVDTLFKESSAQVQAYASQAYQTAGISANSYMEQITSFSASLISSLGGDTAAAAEMGNMAIQDMSDNANKMGTDISTIQQTYQSLARGNYAMLDNLKLGYGGTKAEMERMISDANKVKQANGEMADLSVDSFADVVEAIHLVQSQMGITGTTALEASTTIEGSVNSAKAAWSNWVTELGKDNADMVTLTSQLVTSVTTAARNVVPRVITIASTLATTLSTVLTGFIQNDLPGLITDFQTWVTESLPTIMQTGGSMLGAIVQGLIDNLPQMTLAAFQLISVLMTSIGQSLPTLIPMAMQAVLNFAQGLIASIPTLIPAALQMVVGLAQGISSALPQLAAKAPELIGSLVSGIITNLPQILEAGVQILTNLAVGFVNSIPELLGQIPGMIAQIIDAFLSVDWGSVGMNIITGIASGISGAVGNLIDAALGAAGDALEAVKGWLGIESPSKRARDEIGRYIPAGIGVGIRQGTGGMLRDARTMADDLMGSIRRDVGAVSLSVDGEWPGYAGAGARQGRQVNQTFVFNQPVETPDEFARAMRLRERYGLAAVQ